MPLYPASNETYNWLINSKNQWGQTRLILESMGSDSNGTYLSQIVLFEGLDRHSGAGRNPGKRPPLVHLDPGLRRDDGGFELK